MQDVIIQNLTLRRGNSGIRAVVTLAGVDGRARPALTLVSYALHAKPCRSASGELDITVPSSTVPTEVKFEIPQEPGRPMMLLSGGADLTLVAHSSTGVKYRLNISVDSRGNIVSSKGTAAKMDEGEKSAFAESLFSKVHVVGQEGEAAENVWSGFEQKARAVLSRQCAALLKERDYGKRGGGKKHRLFDGLFACRVGTSWAYTFEAESELHMADDAPVTLTIEGASYSGYVISADGLEVTVALDFDLGRKIPSAELAAQPWKLLQSLVERLRQITLSDKIAVRLITEGPSLASEKPSGDIRRGQDAASRAARLQDITVVWGPPGTGKTYTMARVAIDAMRRGETVLMVSHSNVSVDGMALKVAELMRADGMDECLTRGDVVRCGFIHDPVLDADVQVSAFARAKNASGSVGKRIDAVKNEMKGLRARGEDRSARYVQLQVEAKRLQSQFSEAQRRVVDGAKILATTISKACVDPALTERKFDLVILDEASMAYVGQSILAASIARKRFVCVGDFRQLAPIAQESHAQSELGNDVFSFLGIVDFAGRIHSHPWLVMLDEQRRMHPDISAFSNARVYGGLLRDHDGVLAARRPIAEAEPFPGHAAVLADLTGIDSAASKTADNSRFNSLSAFVSYALASAASRAGSSAAVITPYVAQARICRALDRDCGSAAAPIACSTVHQFQGSERDVVVFDPVESGARKPGWLLAKNDGLAVTRLVNVAVTRAKGKLVCVAERDYWSHAVESTNACRQLVAHLSYCRAGTSSIQKGAISAAGVGLYVDRRQAISKLAADFRAADKRVVICMPGIADSQTADEMGEIIKAVHARGVEVIAKCAVVPLGWETFAHKTDDAEQSLIIIDDSLIWCGRLLTNDAVAALYARARSSRAARLLMSFCSLEARVEGGVKVGLVSHAIAGQKSGGVERPAKAFSAFVAERKRCPLCGGPMAVARGRNGTYMKCPACKKTESFSVDFVNSYLNEVGGKCEAHQRDLDARRGQYGIYLHCSNGCTIGLDALG